jgi:predicted aspartyl protease
MGTVLVKLKVSNAENGNEPVIIEDAVVDTGSIHTVLTREIATRLALPKMTSMDVWTAAGAARLESSYAFVELQGRSMMLPLLVNDIIPQTIVGVTLLEWLGFEIDPVRKVIRETDILLL